MIDADIATAPRIEPLPERFECFENERILTVNDSADQSRWHTSELRALSRLEKARTHLYHVSLPRDSVRRSTRFNTSGPNGVITANNHSEVWAADGVMCSGTCTATSPATQTSRIQVIDLKTGKVTHTIDNGGQRRADELCEDPQHHVVLLANDDESDLFLTFISTDSYKIIGKLFLDGTDRNAQNVKATNGIEQCQWSPRTGKFYLPSRKCLALGITACPVRCWRSTQHP